MIYSNVGSEDGLLLWIPHLEFEGLSANGVSTTDVNNVLSSQDDLHPAKSVCKKGRRFSVLAALVTNEVPSEGDGGQRAVGL